MEPAPLPIIYLASPLDFAAHEDVTQREALAWGEQSTLLWVVSSPPSQQAPHEVHNVMVPRHCCAGLPEPAGRFGGDHG